MSSLVSQLIDVSSLVSQLTDVASALLASLLWGSKESFCFPGWNYKEVAMPTWNLHGFLENC